jgi:hypothetical protein
MTGRDGVVLGGSALQFDGLQQNFDAVQQNFVPSEVNPAASVQIATPSDLTRDTAASRFSSLDLDHEARWTATQHHRSQILLACNKYQQEANKKYLQANKSQLEPNKKEPQTIKRQHPRDKEQRHPGKIASHGSQDQRAGSRKLLRRSWQKPHAACAVFQGRSRRTRRIAALSPSLST